MEKILGFLVGFLIGLCIMIPTINLKKENSRLEKQNNDLIQENADYKWQLEQVPYIIKYGCENNER